MLLSKGRAVRALVRDVDKAKQLLVCATAVMHLQMRCSQQGDMLR